MYRDNPKPSCATIAQGERRTVRLVRTQETTCCFDSRFRRKLSGTTGHRLLGMQRPQMLCMAAGSGSSELQSLWGSTLRGL